MPDEEIDYRCGVYLIISPSGGRYVGSSKRLDKRLNRYKNLSCSRQSAILSSLKKYGYENHTFKVLMYCKQSERLFWERIFGDLYLSLADFPNGLNIILPRYNEVPASLSTEFRNKISISQKERFKNPEQRKIVSEKTKAGFTDKVREKMSKIHKARFNNAELRKERSERQKAYYKTDGAVEKASAAQKKYLADNPEMKERNYSALVRYYESNPNKRGANMREQAKNDPNYGKKISERNKQYYIDNPEARKKVSERSKLQFGDRWTNIRSKSVKNIESGEVFSCANEVADMLKVPRNTFRNWLNGISPNNTPYRYLHKLQHQL